MSKTKFSTQSLRVSPQPKHRISKSDQTRADILNAALDFLWTRPFRDMTVTSLMAETGASRSVFYQYFKDLPEVMETLLEMLQEEIFRVVEPWNSGVGDPIVLIRKTLADLVEVCHRRGPFLRAITDAAVADARLEQVWEQFLAAFDDAGVARLEADQKQGLIPDFEARPVTYALNRLNAYTFIQAFGRLPRKEPGPVLEGLARIWISTLYGAEWAGKKSSTLLRK